MGRKSAVGVANGNYRNGDYYQYRLAVARGWNTEPMEQAMNKKKMRAMYWYQRLSNAMGMLYHADPNGWEAWYDDDANVSPDASQKEMALVIEARVKDLRGSYIKFECRTRRGIFIWRDEIGWYIYSKEVGEPKLYILDFNSFDEAETFVKGLPIKNCGYGVVLDLLPVGMLTSAAATSPQE